ncbi:MAG: BsuBI/PstI family type II restriction endonuclease [Anaerobiospirillum succiniciproducens]|uniref:BsuBI/PstI family type II restriction endonuclease n=1 Tax=Anaerobiospirillum succiniciproducens TaxID=13335 RepID=UPI0026DADCB3|nr:BsuBI/PstI family type II restriction endonuclease [Anaerobiospirillum succiniciproducens]MDO4675158.1 BsuBI/PstI family type II restriction endonuclease [Anaerobiospirillum succiniciproducens]
MTNCQDLKIEDKLIKAVLDSFVPEHATASIPVFISGDRSSVIHQDQNVLSDLGLYTNDLMGKTDLVLKIDDPKEPWLCFVSCDHSCGHIDTKRKQELDKIASSSKVKCAYLSVFANMESYSKVCNSIAWSTDVWIADQPTKIISFD